MGALFGGQVPGGPFAGNGSQQSGSQSVNPYADNYKPPTGPQGTPVGPSAPKVVAGETDEERRRRQALILGAPYEGLGDGGDGSGGSASAAASAASDAGAAAAAGTGDGF